MFIKKWISFCGDRVNPFQPSVNNILEFLVTLYNQGLKYSVFQSAQAVINNLTNICGNVDFSNHPLLKRYMMGVFASRPSLRKYSSTWDAYIVLTYIDGMLKTTLLQLSGKLCMLFLLLTAQHCQTLHLIELTDIEINANNCAITTNHLLKSKADHHLFRRHISVKIRHKSQNMYY